MSKDTLDDRYFEWLYGHIAAIRNRNPARSYWHLARLLYTTAFLWNVHNDDNRAEDGKELRYEFAEERNIDIQDPAWMDMDCSMLEMLIALSRRAAFESPGEPGDWFWKFVQNMELDKYTDAVWNLGIEREVEDRLERVIFRKYGADGMGGIFPLRYPRGDQRMIELWYQLSAYLLEGDYVDHGPLL